MSLLTIKITNNQLLEYRNSLSRLTDKSTSLSWSITRSFSYATEAFESYRKELMTIIDVFANKVDGNVVLKDNKVPAIFSNVVFGSEKLAIEALNKLNNEEIEIKVYKPTNENMIAYLKTNPPTNEYIGLDKWKVIQ